MPEIGGVGFPAPAYVKWPSELVIPEGIPVAAVINLVSESGCGSTTRKHSGLTRRIPYVNTHLPG